jgi:hypothetical protein
MWTPNNAYIYYDLNHFGHRDRVYHSLHTDPGRGKLTPVVCNPYKELGLAGMKLTGVAEITRTIWLHGDREEKEGLSGVGKAPGN